MNQFLNLTLCLRMVCDTRECIWFGNSEISCGARQLMNMPCMHRPGSGCDPVRSKNLTAHVLWNSNSEIGLLQDITFWPIKRLHPVKICEKVWNELARQCSGLLDAILDTCLSRDKSSGIGTILNSSSGQLNETPQNSLHTMFHTLKQEGNS